MTGVVNGADAASAELDLRRYVRGLIRRKFTIVGVVLVAVATAVGVSALQSVKYEAQAQVALEPVSTPSLFNQSTPPQTDPQVSVDTEIQVIESPPVRAAVIKQLGSVDKASASRVGQTVVIAIHGFAATALRAAEVANAYAQAYLTLSKSRASSQLVAAAQQIQNQIDTIQTQLDSLDRQLATTSDSQQSALTASRTALVSEEDTFRQELSEVQVEASLTTGGAHLVADAFPPSSPVQPKPIRNAALAVVAGLLLGVGLACLAEFLDDTIRTIDDVERFRPLPLLASVPAVADRGSRTVPQLALMKGRAASSEAYRSLRTGVQLLGVVRPLTTLQLTSAAPAEGKTTTVANLATVLADAGRKVALVDCDLRRPMLHRVFGLGNKVGLTSVLLGEHTLAAALQPVAEFPGLSVLTSGALAPNPSELLGSRQTAEIICSLQSMFDVVLLDSPPVLPVTDAIVLSQWVEAVIIVSSGGITKRKSLRRAIQVLRQSGAPLAGIVLNRAAPEPEYSYHYTYGQDVDDDGGRSRRRPRHAAGKAAPVGDPDPATGEAAAGGAPDPAAGEAAAVGVPDSAAGEAAADGASDHRTPDVDGRHLVVDEPAGLPPANGHHATPVGERPR
ncbi:MAG: polysaccharide biosynthesis tyrosine autokinase [Acidimicrobiales bacterium]